MKRYAHLISILMLTFLGAVPAQAEILNLNYLSVATGIDEGPQNGVFDTLTDLNLGSVVNNGWTSFRTAFEFSLAALPAGVTINSARLTVGLSNYEGTRGIQVHGYPGNGAVGLSDLSTNRLLGSTSIDVGYQTLTFDVTGFVAGVVAGGGTFAGFNVREEPANTPNYLIMQLALPTLPLLSLDLSTEPIRVDLDIKPGSIPNAINPKSKGKIPVAILSSSEFDAPVELDSHSLTFGRTGDEKSLAFCNRSPVDVNRDGMVDIVCHFKTGATGFLSGDTQGVLKGKTLSGVGIKGTDSVRLVPSTAR